MGIDCFSALITISKYRGESYVGAAFTHAQQEFIALENIEAQGWTGYLPQYEKTISHARKRLVLSPLFPRYLFINFAKTICS